MHDELLALMQPRSGHVVFESGHHGTLWLDLDRLWTHPRELAPFLSDLACRLPVDSIDIVCGPMSGGAFAAFAIAAELDLSFCFVERTMQVRADGTTMPCYSLPRAFRDLVDGRRVAVVDDVMNAGSATRGAVRALASAGARVTAMGALLVLGDAVPAFAAASGIELVATGTMTSELWLKEECPLCASRIPIDFTAI
jgi:orotate phosphoribosyltransferase